VCHPAQAREPDEANRYLDVMPPGRTQYTLSGDKHIAYSVTGDGPIDVLYVPTWLNHIEQVWTHPMAETFFDRLASFGRLIMFDRRGVGLSDSMTTAATLEEQMDDVVAVLDAAGSERAALVAMFEGASMAALFAATHPDRVGALVTFAGWVRMKHSPEMPWTFTPEQRAAFIEGMMSQWGEGGGVERLAGDQSHDPALRDWFGRLERYSSGPGQMRAIQEVIGETDVRAVLPSIRVPTLVMHRRDDPVIDVRHARVLADGIPDAKLVLLDGEASLPLAGDQNAVLDEIEQFVTGQVHEREPDRVLATVMFTDIVDSTVRAAELGDRRWRDLLEQHDRLIRRAIERHRGREVKSLGDGFLATFDGPARAIRAAASIVEAVPSLGLDVRAGLHTGECEMRGDDVAGLAVHIGARVGAMAGAGEVLVSSTVRDLVVGSGIEFDDRGAHPLKGIPGEWRLFAVAE
jgi:class 3 adenylate cyclase